MKLILDWAWDRVVDIKDQLDQLCKNFILDHHNSLLIDSFKRMKREFTAHFSKIIPSLEISPVAVANISSRQKSNL